MYQLNLTRAEVEMVRRAMAELLNRDAIEYEDQYDAAASASEKVDALLAGSELSLDQAARDYAAAVQS